MKSPETLSDHKKEQDIVYTFPDGIPGFESCTQYKLFHQKNQDKNIFLLQANEQPEVTFTLVDPVDYGLNYDFTLSDEEQEILGAKSVEEMAVLLMLAKIDDPADPNPSGERSLHANIVAPLIFNIKTKRGLQKLLKNMNYSMNLHEE